MSLHDYHKQPDISRSLNDIVSQLLNIDQQQIHRPAIRAVAIITVVMITISIMKAMKIMTIFPMKNLMMKMMIMKWPQCKNVSICFCIHKKKQQRFRQ
jgi:hypothetical protein